VIALAALGLIAAVWLVVAVGLTVSVFWHNWNPEDGLTTKIAGLTIVAFLWPFWVIPKLFR